MFKSLPALIIFSKFKKNMSFSTVSMSVLK
jgi:hypothetical protein